MLSLQHRYTHHGLMLSPSSSYMPKNMQARTCKPLLSKLWSCSELIDGQTTMNANTKLIKAEAADDVAIQVQPAITLNCPMTDLMSLEVVWALNALQIWKALYNSHMLYIL